MNSSKKNFLITGLPGCGKSSLIARLIESKNVGGVLTPEFRKNSRREGFKIIDIASGKEGVLAAIGIKGPKVSRYGVNIKDLEEIGAAAIEHAVKSSPVIIIDELGKMEMYSERFKAAVESALNSNKPVVATISLKSKDEFIERIKQRKDCKLFLLNRTNFEDLLKELKQALESSV